MSALTTGNSEPFTGGNLEKLHGFFGRMFSSLGFNKKVDTLLGENEEEKSPDFHLSNKSNSRHIIYLSPRKQREIAFYILIHRELDSKRVLSNFGGSQESALAFVGKFMRGYENIDMETPLVDGNGDIVLTSDDLNIYDISLLERQLQNDTLAIDDIQYYQNFLKKTGY